MERAGRALAEFLISGKAQYLFIVFLVYGMLLILSALIVDLGNLQYEGKQVGYFTSLNWSVGLTLFMPIIFYCSLRVIRIVDTNIKLFSTNRMLLERVSEGEVVLVSDTSGILESWKSQLGKVSLFMILVLIMTLMFSLVEWYDNSYKVIETGLSQDTEVDWSVAAYVSSEVNPLSNKIFTFFAFVLQGVAGAVFIFVFAVAYLTGTFFNNFANLTKNYFAIPSPMSGDERLGFERFEQLGFSLSVALGLIVFSLYLTVLQNEFLRAEEAENILWLFFGLIQDVLDKDISGAFTEVVSFNFSNIICLLGMFASLGTFLFFVGRIFLDLATEARNNFRWVQEEFSAVQVEALLNIDSVRLQKFDDNVEKMKLWPYKFFRMNTASLFLIPVSISFFFYMYLPYLFFIYLVFIIRNLFKKTEQ